MKTAVAKVLKGKNRKEQENFTALKAHYLFDSQFCNVAKGNEKGQVESAVGDFRRNILVPEPVVHSFEELNLLIATEVAKHDDLNLVPHTKETINVVFTRERELLLPLPKYAFDCCQVKDLKVSKESTVRFENNRYSVPDKYLRQTVQVKGYVYEVKAYSDGELIAVHPRSYSSGEDILDINHYLNILERKPYAVNNAKALKMANLPKSYFEYLQKLREHNDNGNREFVKILKLRNENKVEVIDEVLKIAMDCHVYNYDGVKALFDGLYGIPETPRPLQLSNLDSYTVVAPDLSQFDRLKEAEVA